MHCVARQRNGNETIAASCRLKPDCAVGIKWAYGVPWSGVLKDRISIPDSFWITYRLNSTSFLSHVHRGKEVGAWSWTFTSNLVSTIRIRGILPTRLHSMVLRQRGIPYFYFKEFFNKTEMSPCLVKFLAERRTQVGGDRLRNGGTSYSNQYCFAAGFMVDRRWYEHVTTLWTLTYALLNMNKWKSRVRNVNVT
jgi:hypothetical protein